MRMGGVFREIEVPSRIVATEKFDEAWYPGEALNTTAFVQQRSVTKTTIRLRYQSQEARDTARRSVFHGNESERARLPDKFLPARRVDDPFVSEPCQ